MEFVNNTGFPALAFRQYDRAGELVAVVTVRGTFDIVPGSTLQVATEQEPIQWTDVFDGDPQACPMVRQADLVPFKPGTDVTVLGDAHCPDPAGAPSWPCGLRILAGTGAAVLDKQLRVTGPRWWRPQSRPNWRALLHRSESPLRVSWELMEPERAHRVALDWRLALGGALPDEPGAVHAGNPIGMGIVGQHGQADAPMAAPQIELASAPVGDAHADAIPAGLGPIPGVYEARARHAGTYDQAWLELRDPLCPNDFDERYWQCAPPDQVVSPWLRGAERFELLNLHAEFALLSGTLPGIMPGLVVNRPSDPPARLALNLDGVHFDVREGWDRVVLTWRVRLPMAEAVGVRLTLTERARVAMTA